MVQPPSVSSVPCGQRAGVPEPHTARTCASIGGMTQTALQSTHVHKYDQK
jgi:hypothetical protein